LANCHLRIDKEKIGGRKKDRRQNMNFSCSQDFLLFPHSKKEREREGRSDYEERE